MNNTLLKNSTTSLLIIASLAIKAQINVASAIGSSSSEYSSKLRGSGLAFTPNKGQIADIDGKPCPEVLYKGQSQVADIYLRKTGISYVQSNMGEVMHKIDKQVEELSQTGVLDKMDEQKKKEELLQKQKVKVHRIDMDFEGANMNCRLINEDELDGYNNYYYAHCPQGITHVKQYNRVTYKDIYKGIDIKYYGDKQNGIKYDLIVQAHADPGQIKINWKGAEEIKLESSKLIVESSLGEMTETLPKVYQNINGKIVDVECKYMLDMRCEMLDLRGRHYGSQSHVSCLKSHIYEVSFELGTYNPELPLIIDPYWATYYANSPNTFEASADITTDQVGNVLITGNAMTPGFPVLAGGYSQAYAGGGTSTGDAYVVKFNSAGLRLWACLIGGTSGDNGHGIATDNQNNIIITGETYSANFPVLAGSGYTQTLTGTINAFVVKFDAGGFRLWGCFYGGTAAERRPRVATDVADNIIICGETFSTDFPLLSAGGYSQSYGGNTDAFVVKFNASGILLWALMYGGDNTEYQMGIATDKLNNIIITGSTRSANFPVSAGAQQLIFGGADDAFVVSLNTSGVRNWATFYGGTSFDNGFNIVTDKLDNVVIVGSTASADFPIGSIGANVVSNATYSGTDCFLVKFNSGGSRLWATFYNSSRMIMSFVAIDGSNNVYLLTEVEDAPSPNLIDACSYQPIFNGGSTAAIAEDQIIVKYKPNGEKVCSTYLGGTKEDDLDAGGGITIDGSSLYITAYTHGGYPVTAGAFQTVYGGGSNNTFVASICTNICEGKTLVLNYNASATNICNNVTVKFTPSVTNSCDTAGYRFHWEFTGGNPGVSDSVNPIVKFSNSGTHDVKLVVTTLCKKDSLTKTNYITTTTCNTCTLVGQFTKGTAACSNCGCQEWVLVNGVNGTPPYTYQWPDGYDKRYKNKLCPGNYSVKVTDTSGCSVDVNVSAP